MHSAGKPESQRSRSRSHDYPKKTRTRDSHQEQVGTRLDGQESGSGDVDSDGVPIGSKRADTTQTLVSKLGSKTMQSQPRAQHSPEVLDGGTDGGLELDDGFSLGGDLVVDNDLQVQLVVVQNALHRGQLHPHRVGVEDLELVDVLELFQVIRGHLGDFEQTEVALVVDQGTSLDVGLGLVGELHEVLGLRVDHLLVNVQVDGGTQVVDVGDKDVLFASSDQLVEQARVAVESSKPIKVSLHEHASKARPARADHSLESVQDVSVPGRVESGIVRIGLLGDGQQGVPVDTGVLGLVEGEDVDVVVLCGVVTGSAARYSQTQWRGKRSGVRSSWCCRKVNKS